MSESAGEFSTEPVPSQHTVAWWRVGLISAMVGFSLPTFVTGVEVSNAVTPERAVWALVLGGIILTIIGSVTGVIGARTRLSSYMLVKIAFGDAGAAVVNIVFAISLLGWFGVNIDLFGGAVVRLFHDVFDISVPTWVAETGAGIVMTITTLYGFKAINLLSAILVPVLLVVTAMLVSTSLGVRSLEEVFTTDVKSTLSLGDATSSVVGTVIVGAIILPDITRFVREWQDAALVALLSYLIVGVAVMCAGAFAAVALANDDLLDIMIVMGLGLAAFAIVIAGSWVLNTLNLYSTTLSIEATWPRVNNTVLILLLGAFGTAAAFLNILDHFLTFLFYLSIIFVPVAGVISIDYLVLRQSAYHEDRVSLRRAISPVALVAWGAGALIALLGAEGIVTMSGFAAIDAMLVSAISYWMFNKLGKSR